jgi:AraC-like DNA-binding protein
MQYTQHELFVGAVTGAPNCTTDLGEQEIWPKFMLMVMLQGAQSFSIDGSPFHLDAGPAEAPAPLVFMLNVARYSRLRFFGESEVPLHKVMIAAPLPWLKRLLEAQDDMPVPALRSFFSEHLAHFSFAPGQHILQLAHKIINPPPLLEGELGALYLRAQGLDIMWQSCLTMVAEREGRPQAPSLMTLRNCERVRDYITANLDRELTIAMIAREAGASVSTVQRHFKEHFGITIFDFIRQERLEAARAALAGKGIPVSHAAHLAGYNNISSFTTAFRKAYGVTPSRVRI